MGFEQFAPARDFFYLAALFLGAGFGCILNCFRRKATTRFRNLTITAGFCFFSGMVAALTAAVILSYWMIVKETALYIPLGILAAVLMVAFRFPRAVGFPLFIISGVFAVALGFTCLSFPAMDGLNRVLVTRDGNNVLHIRPIIQKGNDASSPEADSTILVSLKTFEEDSVIEFRARCLTFTKHFPLVGGVNRGVFTEIVFNNEVIYTDSRPGWKIFTNLYSQSESKGNLPDFFDSFFSFWEIGKDLDLRELNPGMGMTVFFDGVTLTFR